MLSCRVEPVAVADLALAPQRAALAVVVDGSIQLFPVHASLVNRGDVEQSARLVQLPPDSPDLSGRDVVLISDDGPEWFRLRALTIRGVAQPDEAGGYRVEPRRAVAWDFGRLREDPQAEPGPDLPPLPAQPPVPAPAPPSGRLAEALLEARVMLVATRSVRGTPFVVPLWFVVHHGRIHADTAESSWTVRNIASNGDVAVLLGGERGVGPPVLVVRGRGRAVKGKPPAAVTARMALRYFVSPRFARDELRHYRLWGRRAQFYGESESAFVELTPIEP